MRDHRHHKLTVGCKCTRGLWRVSTCEVVLVRYGKTSSCTVPVVLLVFFRKTHIPLKKKKIVDVLVKKYNKNEEPWKSSRILRVKPKTLEIFEDLAFVMFLFFPFFLCFFFNFSFFFHVCHFSYFSFFHSFLSFFFFFLFLCLPESISRSRCASN